MVDRLRICVLTGDPRLPDPTKREHRYNEEDFATDRAMREALRIAARLRFRVPERPRRAVRALRRRPAGSGDQFLRHRACATSPRRNCTSRRCSKCWACRTAAPRPRAWRSATTSRSCVWSPARWTFRCRARSISSRTGNSPRAADLYPALIKPNQGDGSVGITKDAVVRSRAEAQRYVAWLRRELPGRALLVQEYLPGPEYGVGLIGNPGSGLEALPVLEVDFSGLPAGLAPILSFESKTLPDSPYWTEIRFRRAEADDALLARMVGHARRLFARLGCRDYARFDFRCAADGEPRLLEVNPNPAWANDGKLAFMAGLRRHRLPGHAEDDPGRRAAPPRAR